MSSRSASLLREARLRSGLTQVELAGRTATTQSAISRWERGRARPSFEILQRLVRACGLELQVTIEELDPGDSSLIEAHLALSPEERLDQLVRVVAFIRAGRAALALSVASDRPHG